MRTKIFINGLLLFLFVIFIIQNMAVVDITFLFWDVEIPRVILLFITFVLGAGFWALLPLSKLTGKGKD